MILDIATAYIARGFSVVPIPPRTKGPVLTGWQKLRIKAPHDWFDPTSNIGVILGEPSGGLICVDLDHPKAVELAEKFLPPTGLIAGREGGGKVHWFYRVASPMKKTAFVSACKIKLIEVLADGQQVVVGPSIHPSGGRYDDLEGEAAEITADDLLSAVDRLFSECLSQLGLLREPSRIANTDTANLFGNEPLNVERWLQKHNRTVGKKEVKGDLTIWYIHCPNITSHTSENSFRDCCVTQESSGRLGGKCFHASCGMASWTELQAAIGPLEFSDFHDPTNDSDVNLSGIMNTRPIEKTSTEQKQPIQPGTFSSDFYDVPGLIGEMVKHHCGHAPRPRPELSLAASIALVGTITGRKIRTKSGMRTNIYCVGLAPSGSGKERPRNNNLMAFTEAGLPHFLGSENPASDAALIGELDENPAMLIQIDEVSRYFATIKTAGNNSSHLRNIFTRFLELTGQSENPCWRPKGYADSKKSKTIAFPHLCIYGTSTAEGFWSSVQSSDAVDGFLARMMVIEADSKYPRLRQTETAETPQIVLDIMRDWDQFSPGYGNLKKTVQQTLIVPFDSAAEDRLLEQSAGIEDRLETESDDQRAIWSRTAALATKLSLIFAASRGPESLLVTLADANAAVKLANWCTRLLIRRVFTHVTENDYERAKKRMMQIIRQAGSISQSELTRKTQWIRNSRERREVTQELLEMGLVELIPGVAGISASLFKSIE